MKTLLKTLFLICLLSASAHAQGSRADNSVLRPSAGIPGAQIAICQPLATTAAAVSANQATYIMASNPVTAGFVQGMVVQVTGFTGADTYFNAGTLANGGIANGQIILNVTPTTIVTTLIHASGSATSNGTILGVGTASASCGALASIFTDTTLLVSQANPFTSDTMGNFGYGANPGIYYTQIYGNGITTQFKQTVVPCVPISSCGSGGVVIGGNISAGQTAFGNGTDSIAGGTVVLDMAGLPAASDLGALMNACVALLPTGIGTCRGDNLSVTTPLTLSTPVTTTTAAVFTYSGQTINQSAAVTFGAGSGINGCNGVMPFFNKTGNIDQITLNGGGAFAKCVQLEGNKASFTGNGIVLNSINTTASGNNIDGEASNDIEDITGTPYTGNIVENNILTGWGLHAFTGNGSVQKTQFVKNQISGDGTASGAAVSNLGCGLITNNTIADGNAFPTVDDSVCTSSGTATVGTNTIKQTAGYPGVLSGAVSLIDGNFVQAGGTHGPAITGSGTITHNYVLASNNSDGIDATGGVSTVDGNIVNVSYNGVSGKCGINAVGDQILTKIINNYITVQDTAADTNYGECDTTVSGHNLDVLFSANSVSGFLSGGATVFGHWTDNAGNINTNWSLIVEKISCLHITTCIKRTDTQNNASIYRDIQQGDAALDAGGGSTVDQFLSGTFTLGSYGGSVNYAVAACETAWGPTTLSGASTLTGLNCLPANAIIDAVVYRITTTITTAVSFTVGDSGSATRYCGTQSTLTAGTTGTCTAAGYYLNTGPLAVKITPNASPGAGAIRLQVFYHTWTAPTS